MVQIILPIRQRSMFPLCKTQLIRTSNQSTILAKMIWQFTVFPVKSDLPQVQRFLVSSIIKVIYELPDKLLKNLKSSEIRKYSPNLRTGFGHKLVLNPYYKYQFLGIATKVHAKPGIKVFLLRAVLLDLFTFCHILWQRFYWFPYYKNIGLKWSK